MSKAISSVYIRPVWKADSSMGMCRTSDGDMSIKAMRLDRYALTKHAKALSNMGIPFVVVTNDANGENVERSTTWLAKQSMSEVENVPID